MSDWEFQDRREEMARREVGHTLIRPALSLGLIVFFLLVILSVPLVQHVAEFSDYAAGKRRSPLPQAYDVFSLLPAAMTALRRFRVIRRPFPCFYREPPSFEGDERI